MRLSRYSLNSERSSKNLSHCNSRNTGSAEPKFWSVERTPSGSEPESKSSSERIAYTPITRAIGTKRRSDFRRTIIQNRKIAVYFEFAMYLHLKPNRVGKAQGSESFHRETFTEIANQEVSSLRPFRVTINSYRLSVITILLSRGFRAGIEPPLFQIRSKGHTIGMSKSITQQSIPLPYPAIPRGHPHLSRGSL